MENNPSEKWVGCIKEIYDDSFYCHLYYKGNDPDIPEILEATFNIKDIPKDQIPFIQEGVIFHWNINKRTGESVFQVQEVNWQDFDINTHSDKVQAILNFFQG